MKESQLDNKTAIATNDYVRMVDENGNSVKIKKDSFMAAIRDALPSIISDGETGAGSVLSIINGALKTRTDANLASVLGDGNEIDSSTNLNQLTKAGIYWWKSSLPSNTGGSETWCYVVVKTLSNRYIIQYVYRITGSDFLRKRTIDTQASTIDDWISKIDVAEGILSDNTILSGLASALGGVTIDKKTSSSNPIDFDTLTTAGVNYLIGAASVNAYINSPFPNGQCWGILTCQKASTSRESYVVQTFNDARGQFYKRAKNDDTWGDWKRCDNL